MRNDPWIGNFPEDVLCKSLALLNLHFDGELPFTGTLPHTDLCIPAVELCVIE